MNSSCQNMNDEQRGDLKIAIVVLITMFFIGFWVGRASAEDNCFDGYRVDLNFRSEGFDEYPAMEIAVADTYCGGSVRSNIYKKKLMISSINYYVSKEDGNMLIEVANGWDNRYPMVIGGWLEEPIKKTSKIENKK